MTLRLRLHIENIYVRRGNSRSKTKQDFPSYLIRFHLYLKDILCLLSLNTSQQCLEIPIRKLTL